MKLIYTVDRRRQRRNSPLPHPTVVDTLPCADLIKMSMGEQEKLRDHMTIEYNSLSVAPRIYGVWEKDIKKTNERTIYTYT